MGSASDFSLSSTRTNPIPPISDDSAGTEPSVGPSPGAVPMDLVTTLVRLVDQRRQDEIEPGTTIGFFGVKRRPARCSWRSPRKYPGDATSPEKGNECRPGFASHRRSP